MPLIYRFSWNSEVCTFADNDPHDDNAKYQVIVVYDKVKVTIGEIKVTDFILLQTKQDDTLNLIKWSTASIEVFNLDRLKSLLG